MIFLFDSLRTLAGAFAVVGLLICAAAWLFGGAPRSDMDLAYCIALHAITVFAGGLWLISKSEAA
jgi:type IV secretory pathway VirB2 component (pilin)